MKNTVKLLVLVCCFFAVNLTYAQQKIGYVNSAEILSSMAEWKAAETNLKTFTTQLENELKSIVTKLEDELQAFNARYQNGDVTQREFEEKQQYFQQKELEVQQFELNAQQKVAKKQEELTTPILTKVENAIDAVGTENGFSYILDSSVGILLFATETEDVSPLVKAKL